jgi:CheY-like chemotaxis protein
MAHLLEKWGVNVLEAESAEAALALIDELGILPDCFLVDHALGPGMDGLAFLQVVQARHRSVAARIITADHSATLAAAAAAVGVGVLYKPIEPRALEAFLAALG